MNFREILEGFKAEILSEGNSDYNTDKRYIKFIKKNKLDDNDTSYEKYLRDELDKLEKSGRKI